MVLYIAIAAFASWVYFFWHPEVDRRLAVAISLSFSSLLAFRILLNTVPSGYPIYYNGPAALSLFLIALPLLTLPETSRSILLPAEALACDLCLTAVVFYVRREES